MARDAQTSLHEVLHHMHATASRSDSLTTFDDLTAPPASPGAGEPKGIDLVQGGLSGLYSRIRASVGGAREPTQDAPLTTRSPAGTAVSSPVFVSGPSSRLQSPSTATFPDALPPSRDSNVSATTLSSKHSVNVSKSSLATTRSRPPIPPSIVPGKLHNEDDAFVQSPASIHSKVQSSAGADVTKHGSAKEITAASSPRFAPGRDEVLRKRKGQRLDGEVSDDSDSDVIVVDDEGHANNSGSFKFPPDSTRESVGKGSPWADGQTQSARSALSKARDQAERTSQSTQAPHVATNVRTPVLAPEPLRPPMLHVGASHLPGFRPSRTSSSDGLSSIVTSNTVRTPAVAPIQVLQRQAHDRPAASSMSKSAFTQMRRKILDREFWMRDENAKDCFNCGDAFTTFRRKHHCRTCGQIFDSKCTSIVSGKMFGQQSNLKVCKPCEAIIHGHDDDSSVYTDDGDQNSIYDPGEAAGGFDDDETEAPESDYTKIGTPTISIPMSRKTGSEKKRRSHVIEVGPQTLTRPSSSRSLRSLSGRPRSSSHKRYHSRHQHMRHVKHDDRAPFHQYHDNSRGQPSLSAFHHDNIIDPDLAPFMSDEGSSEEEQASIFATLSGDSAVNPNLDNEKSGLGGLLAAMRKGKSKMGDKSVASGGHARDTDNISITSRNATRLSRRRNLSVSSVSHKPSPRRTKSNTLLRPYTPGFGPMGATSQPGTPQSYPSPSPTPPTTKITRSASMLQRGITPKVELNKACLDHARKLLKQMLRDAGVSHVSSWEKALIPILRQCTDDVSPDVDRGDDIDVRNYIKLKKIPGGKPRDTAYVSGVVFSKNVALRSMPRSIPNPRIVVITFAIEYARHQTHFMSLEPVIAQEREYLKNLVSRIAALQPHVLLVQRNVSGLALEFLEQEGIAVAYNVKSTVLNAVARCTGLRMISSVDKLAMDPSHLGYCDSFDVKTYVHKGVKKTYIFLSGCQKELGCTIVLRGAEDPDLVKLKRVTEFMTYVVYNLRLETCLMRDEFIDTPVNSITGSLDSSQNETNESQKQSADPSNTAPAISVDPEIVNEEHSVDDATPSYYSDMVENHRTKILSSSPFVKFMQPYLLEQARQYERKLSQLKRLKSQHVTTDEEKTGEPTQRFELVQPEMVHTVVEGASKQVREFLSAVHASEYDRALHQYTTQRRQWEQFLSGNTDLYDPFNHQKIAVLYSVVNTSTSTPCIGPEIIALGFYQEHDYDDGFTPDCTLGQYVEHLCSSAGVLCEDEGCNRRMLDHSRQYVHGAGQMSVIIQKHPPKLKGMYQTILMWSCCRLCGHETQTFPMSEWTWKYSFAKYLELTFWSTQLHPRAGVCPHDIHKDHVRYFGYNNIALRIQYDPVPMYEVIVPKPNVTWNVDSDLRLKNGQYSMIEEKLDSYMFSIRNRIQGIRVESLNPDVMEMCRKEVELLMKRAHDEHEWLRGKLQDKYMNSKYYEIIPMNRAIRAIQEKAIAWDETFMEFEKQFFPSETDIRRLAALQLKKIFLERDESTSSLTSVDEGTESSTDEPYMDEKGEPVVLTPMPSDISPEAAHDMLASVVDEDQSNSNQSKDAEVATAEDGTTAASKILEVPVQTPRDALDREDVRHLDLAVSSNFPDSSTTNEQPLKTPPIAQDADQFDEGSPTPTSYPRVNPIDKAVVDAIDSTPAPPSPTVTSHTPPESKIPRLVDNARRETAARPVALVRTQSQPSNIPKHISSFPGPSVFNNGPISPKPAMSDQAKALERMTERLGLGSTKQSKTTSRIPRSIPFKNHNKVSKLAEHFEVLSREFEKERMRERHKDRNRLARAYPLARSKPVVEVYKNVHDAVQENNASDEELRAESPPRASFDDSTLGDSTFTEATEDVTTASQSPVEDRRAQDAKDKHPKSEESVENPSHPSSDVEADTSDTETTPEDIPLPDSIASSQLLNMSDSQLESSLELPRHEKTTLLKMLTSFWSERSASGWAPLEYPFSQIEHVWQDSDIIIREDEPSSIIALALSSPDYVAKLRTFRNDNLPTDMNDQNLETSEQSIERNLLHEKNTNIRYSFTNRGVKAQCKIFYAQSFDALRRKCGVADRIVESLSRCSKWDSKGGKSKSIFLKTLDDRFILKSLSPIEVQAFFKFAPNYFAFTHQNLFKSLPSVIAKMFGLFQVQIKTPTGRDFDWYMLVMENLFYDREPNRRYDLKGSMRNRKITVTGERDEVLLDENLVDIIYSETPIFVREHTKKLLKASVWNDTLFLSQNNVMDYSLMAGFDDTNREIIVGIIDCIRTYTWDKKLESWIKDRGKNKPTITSPKDYRNRFRIAMEKYILQAPNCWHQFSGRLVGNGVVGRRLVMDFEGGESNRGGHKRVPSGGSMGRNSMRGKGTSGDLEKDGYRDERSRVR